MLNYLFAIVAKSGDPEPRQEQDSMNPGQTGRRVCPEPYPEPSGPI